MDGEIEADGDDAAAEGKTVGDVDAAAEGKAVDDELEEEVGDEGEDDDVAALTCKLYILSLDDPPQYSSEFP